MASYAARINQETGATVETELGERGQFDVLVNGKTVVSRKGGLLALIFRKPWPNEEDVASAVKEALGM